MTKGRERVISGEKQIAIPSLLVCFWFWFFVNQFVVVVVVVVVGIPGLLDYQTS